MNDFVTKPFDPEGLFSKIENWLNKTRQETVVNGRYVIDRFEKSKNNTPHAHYFMERKRY
jgi:DNA-binding response OmpR family regulator